MEVMPVMTDGFMKRDKGIKKKAKVHTLRPSFATHLMERETELMYIHELLGQKSLKTTEIHTHVEERGWKNKKSV